MAVESRAGAALLGLAYAFGYLYALGDLDRVTNGSWGVVPGDPGLWLTQRGMLYFEPIAMIEFGPVLLLLSPLNIVLATVLGLLLALNLDGAWQLWRHPRACALEAGHNGQSGRRSGGGSVLAAVPALLAGGACCAPSMLLILGIPGLGAFAGLFAWMLPLSWALLGVSRFWQRRQGAPPWFCRRAAAAEPVAPYT